MINRIPEKLIGDGLGLATQAELDAEAASRVSDVAALKADVVQRAINIASAPYNAALDGVTDDSAAWIAAHEALPATGGKILLPVGKSKITQHLTFTKPLVIEGVLSPSLSDTIGSIILLSGSGEITLSGDASGVRDINITGAVGNTGNGINFTGGRPWGVNLLVSEQGQDGIVVGSESVAVNVNSFNFVNIKAKTNGRHGMLIAHPNVLSDANAGAIFGLDTGGNIGDGLKLYHANSNNIVGLHAESNTGNNLTLVGSGNNVILNPYLEQQGSADEVNFDADSNENKVIGMTGGHFATNKVTDLGELNQVYAVERNKAVINWLQGSQYFKTMGVSDHAATGYWDFSQNTSTGTLEVKRLGTSTGSDIDFTQSTGVIRLLMDKIVVGGAQAITKNILAIGTQAFGTINANSTKDLTKSSPGVVVGDFVSVTRTTPLDAGLVLTAFVSASDVVTIRMANVTTSNIATASDSYRTLATRAE